MWYIRNAKRYPFAAYSCSFATVFRLAQSLELFLLRADHYTCLHADRKGRHFDFIDNRVFSEGTK